MKMPQFNHDEIFSAILERICKNNKNRKHSDDGAESKAELFCVDQMKLLGEQLAARHHLKPRTQLGGRSKLLTQLARNEAILLAARRQLSVPIASDRRRVPAVDWLLDNFYLLEENIHTTRRHFPASYHSELPRLADGENIDIPRVYVLAEETIIHGDGRLDMESLSALIVSYQETASLELGELWAIPIMLRLALIENIRRLTAALAANRIARDLADVWADRMMADLSTNPSNLILTVADLARSNPPMTSSFVATLTGRLQSQDAALSLPFTWLEQWLAAAGETIDLLIAEDLQQQAADQVSMGNSIDALRNLDKVDWHQFVEDTSRVEAVLRRDPAGIYAAADFETRDRCRHVIEKLAHLSPRISEESIAREVLKMAVTAMQRDEPLYARHVGYYLIDRGRDELCRQLKIRKPGGAMLRSLCRRFAFPLYGLAILGVMTLCALFFLLIAYESGLHGWGLGLIGVLAWLGTSNLAVAMVNCLAMLTVKPKRLPRMDFSQGIPEEFRTLVAVPCMLSSKTEIAVLVRSLEVAYLANRDAHLHFGLLSDFKDSPAETAPEDSEFLEFARTEMAKLNRKYPDSSADIFYLFHRPRLWNSKEGVWMGFERKRGKLGDLNRLLRGRANGSFETEPGHCDVFAKIRYVITLDSDTLLPRDAARQMIETMAHPLNRPRYDEFKQRVTGGYGVLQPRVTLSLSGMKRSLYARMYTNEWGIDPYTRSVSDVYQDLFGEGSFIGKGIYDVDVFDKVLGARFPDNRILSHDLLEGCYIRSGLLSDVPLYEEYPASYLDDVNRRRRWIRGDWQVARWILPRVPGADGKACPNPLSMLSRWKLTDNLLRSLAPAGLFFLLFSGWAMLPWSALWTWGLIGIVLLPGIMVTTLNLFQKSNEVTWKQHLDTVCEAVLRRFFLGAFNFACLPYEVLYTADSIARAIWRLSFSHHKLLEWRPSDCAVYRVRGGAIAAFRMMAVGPGVVGIATALFAWFRPELLAAASPILLLWLVSPLAVWQLSRPLCSVEKRLPRAEILFLRKTARKTWSFFTEFVGAADHDLPPDNVQMIPVETVAHRTSPTNLGLALLANLSAWDFGTISTGKLLERTARTIDTMARLDRFKGHFYNWYDTVTLLPLPPLYVSSVDSGNLAGHLHVLRMGLLELADRAIVSERGFSGLADVIGILEDVPENGLPSGMLAALREATDRSDEETPFTLVDVRDRLKALRKLSARVPDGEHLPSTTAYWLREFSAQLSDFETELRFMAPWLEFPAAKVHAEVFPFFERIPSLRELAEWDASATPPLPAGLGHFVAAAVEHARERTEQISRLAKQCEDFAKIEYDFLYDASRHLLSIGYNVRNSEKDNNYYDLLASESRLATFTAVAQGKLPQKSWFALGRILTIVEKKPILLSWSGSMFEYLMPLLVMPGYEHTLLADTCATAVEIQIAYGKKRRVPWGVSECGYNAIDSQQNYQYKAFGVPGLGLKRKLADELVIAPYASMLALTVAPREACANLHRLTELGMEGKYGYYEALDHTPSHLPHGEESVIVKSFMVHHQGMGLLALNGVLCGQPMQRRFAADPSFQAALPLLQERTPKATAFYAFTTEIPEFQTPVELQDAPLRVFKTPLTGYPAVHLLSNGRYHLMVTNAGGGYSRWNDLALTRWNADGVRDAEGMFCYFRDVSSNRVWSATHQPVGAEPEHFEAVFSGGRAEFKRSDQEYETHTEIAVSPEDDIELRRIKITNRSASERNLEVTGYLEIVLAPPASDAAHPAFSNLFVQTEIVPSLTAIVATRRPRAPEEQPHWMFHLMATDGRIRNVSYETDRRRFIGRGHSTANPIAVTGQAPGKFSDALSGSAGAVLDPIAAIRAGLTLAPGETVTINWVTGIAETREDALRLAGKYRETRLSDRVFELAWTHEQVLLRQLKVSDAEAQLFMRLASSILYLNPALRALPHVISKNKRGQSGLWGHAISGDLPIVLLKIGNPANIELARQLVQAHAYWHLKGLTVDLVIWNEDTGGYRQILHDQISGLIASGTENNVTDRPGGIFLRNAALISEEDRILIQSCARAILSDRRGTLREQIAGRAAKPASMPRLQPSMPKYPDAPNSPELPARGFSADAREYVIPLAPGVVAPAPWINVLANPNFGTIVSESGQMCTWYGNAHEFRLTPWENDPVCDTGGEAFYLRDEESGFFWSPMPFPCGGARPFVVRHGFGVTTFSGSSSGIHTETAVFTASDAAVKFTVIKIRNTSSRTRRLSVTGCAELVLGSQQTATRMSVITEIDRMTGALFARNRYHSEFFRETAFFDADAPNRSVSCDRLEFLGRCGGMNDPAAMHRTRLSGRTGAGLDPCFAIRVNRTLAPGEECEIIFRLGCGVDADDARTLVRRFRVPHAPETALTSVVADWKERLGGIRVETPDHALNAFSNGWLLYQTIGCRLWARCAKYQSGGAFGFRDQLQDVTALLQTNPELVRNHLLLAAAHQFQEGDAQHWWHPPMNRGVRTHCSDDYLWLPYTVCRYVQTSGDTGVLEESLPFLKGRPVNPEEDSYYDLPARSEESATLYEHCVRAIRRALVFGVHGLPLIGSGDWNDGMNQVGAKGKGESVWLGFFLCDVLRKFADLAERRHDSEFAVLCKSEGESLRRNLDRHAWDGAWYRRAYFDDGTPLGSAENTECRIDSIAQSWSVLSGGVDPEKARIAMRSLSENLVDREHRLVRLLTPPFDRSNLEPGYIKGYVPGVRENGGQYTHAAVWAAMAFARQGDAGRAWELFHMLLPLHHAETPEACARYMVEPYVMAADVYAVAPHTGRGGWTWYSGSSGWMYQLILETLLGVTLETDQLQIRPCFPKEWKEFTLRYRYRQTWYHIRVEQAPSDSITLDGVLLDTPYLPLTDNHKEHLAEIRRAF